MTCKEKSPRMLNGQVRSPGEVSVGGMGERRPDVTPAVGAVLSMGPNLAPSFEGGESHPRHSGSTPLAGNVVSADGDFAPLSVQPNRALSRISVSTSHAAPLIEGFKPIRALLPTWTDPLTGEVLDVDELRRALCGD